MNAAPTMAIIRAEDMALVQGDQCAAMILNLLRFWQGERDWVQATLDEIRVGILSAYGKTRIAAAMKLLRENGIVNAQHNPDCGQVRTLQYQVVGYVASEGVSRRTPVLTYQDVAIDEPEVKAEPSETGFDMPESDTSSLYKDSDSGIDSESSPREGDEPTQGDKDDDDCPAHIRQEIEQIKTQIGAGRVNAVLDRCNGKARTWHYILKALRNERSQRKPSPSSAAPLRNYAYVPPVDLAWERHLAAGGGA